MKRIHCHLPYLLLLAAVLAFAACSKDGSAGPAGPAGPAGANGTNGTNGTTGPKGDTGVANVIYSAWQTLVFDTIRDPATNKPTGQGLVALLSAPKLTTDILNKGIVHVYFNFDSTSKPYIVPVPYVDNQLFISFQAEAGKIWVLSSEDLSGGKINPSASPIFLFRYVLVPGGVTARSGSGVDWKNYASVQKFLGLKD